MNFYTTYFDSGRTSYARDDEPMAHVRFMVGDKIFSTRHVSGNINYFFSEFINISDCSLENNFHIPTNSKK